MIHGEKDSTYVKIAWVPMMHEITKKGKVLNQETILSNSLENVVGKAYTNSLMRSS
jgi:hypothetical protein